jgi:hypothetical protein
MKALATVLFVAAVAFGAAINCSPYEPDLGDVPYKCAAVEPFCPEGYSCDLSTNNCVSPNGVQPDTGSSGFQCLDDSGFGENDMISGAFQTPVASQQATMSIASAVCPEGDKDHYKIDITQANSNLEVVTFWDSGMPVNVSILNAGGSSIGNGSPTSIDDMGTAKDGMRICVPNLPIGTYYASAFAASSIKNNYHLTIKIVPNC